MDNMNKWNHADEKENAEQEFQPLHIISCADLVDTRYPRIDWIIEDLLKPGLAVLAGAPKIGKSWMILQLGLAVAKGESFWGMKTRKSSVLYITLEDSEERVQDRLLHITDEPAEDLYVTMNCSPMGEAFKKQLNQVIGSVPSTRLVVIDTFQKIRDQSVQMSYAGDYADVSFLKKIADEMKICILLVHHTRKQTDSDYINEISGTNGIAGSADTLMILKKEKRTARKATLTCTGRDIDDRELELELSREDCIWRIKTDSRSDKQQEPFPEHLLRLIAYIGKIRRYDGTNADFCQQFSQYCHTQFNPSRLKRDMNLFRHDLEDAGVYFLSAKKSGIRRLYVTYIPNEDSEKLSDEAAGEEAELWEEPHEAENGLSPTPTEEVRKQPYKEENSLTQAMAEEEAYWQQQHEAQNDLSQAMAEEEASWDHSYDALYDMPPTPTDDDAPPPRRPEREWEQYAYKPYR